MKKIIPILAVMLGISLFAAAQKPNVNKAKNMAFATENPDFAGAKAIIEEAVKSPELNQLAKTWFVGGEVYYQSAVSGKGEGSEISNGEDSKKALNCFLKAYELDNMPNAKGKVKPKYTNKIKDYLVSLYLRYTFVNYGVKQYEARNYKDAIDAFETHTDIVDMPMVAGQKNAPAKDSAYYEIVFYTAQCAWAGNFNQKAIEIYSSLKDKDYEGNVVYQSLAELYKTEKDTVNFEAILKEGVQKFPSEFYYLGNLINLYIEQNALNKAEEYLRQAIANDPNNAQYYVVMCTVLENENKIDEAMSMIDKALELDDKNAEAWNTKGRLIYNTAVATEGLSAEEKDIEKANKIAEDAKNIFKESMPYFEKAVELNPENADYLKTLRSLYYRFYDDDPKYPELYNKVNEQLKSL